MINIKSLDKLTKGQENELKAIRWRARTDLRYLCNELLGYPDVSDEIHGGLIKTLQQFTKPTSEQFAENDKIVNGKWVYTPIHKMLALPGKRRRLILDFRGAMKTTINAQAHAIQWILNYPDVAMLIVQSNASKAEDIMAEIKKHFQANPKFRAAFPEHCPQKGINDWGTKSYFTTCARTASNTRKEHTIMTAGIDTGTAGYHFDVMKFSDIVEMKNIVGDGLHQVKKSFYMMENLLVAPSYWIDVEGTRYHFADLYGDIIKHETKKPVETREYEMYTRAVYRKKTDEGRPQKFTPEELELPNLLDEKGLPISWWPSRFTVDKLEGMRARDPFIFNTQQLQLPLGADPNMIPFPVDSNYPKWITRDAFKSHVPIVSREMSIDTAETVGPRSNFTAITVGAWSGNGRCFVEEIVHRRMLPDALIKQILEVLYRYTALGKPISKVKIEETSFVRGLEVALRREMDLKGIFIPIDFIKRENQTSKTERIINSLQPWYKGGEIIFLDDINCKEELLTELKQFPSGESDDILDSIADLFQNKDWFGRNLPRQLEKKDYEEAERRLLFGPNHRMPPYEWPEQGPERTGPQDSYYNSTGGL